MRLIHRHPSLLDPLPPLEPLTCEKCRPDGHVILLSENLSNVEFHLGVYLEGEVLLSIYV